MSHIFTPLSITVCTCLLTFTACSPQFKVGKDMDCPTGIPVMYKVPAMTHEIVIDASAIRVSLYEGKNLIESRVVNEFTNDHTRFLLNYSGSGKYKVIIPSSDADTKHLHKRISMLENEISELARNLENLDEANSASSKHDSLDLALKVKQSNLTSAKNTYARVKFGDYLLKKDDEPSHLTIQSNSLEQKMVYSPEPYTINPRLPWFGKSEFTIELNPDGTLKTTTNNAEGGGSEAAGTVKDVIATLPIPFRKAEKKVENADETQTESEISYIIIDKVGYRLTYTRTINKVINKTPFVNVTGDTLPEDQFAKNPLDIDLIDLKKLSAYYTVSQQPLPQPSNAPPLGPQQV